MTDATVVEQRVVSVFNSDDDLTNFLAGLRAKYASLYPQYVEIEHVTGDARTADGVGIDACANTDGSGQGTASESFEQKISELRSSLQSLRHILPPRTSTTANLLDSFMAVSGDRAVGVPIAAVAPITDKMPPDESAARNNSCVSSASANQELPAPSSNASDHLLLDVSATHGDPLISEPSPPAPRSLIHASVCNPANKNGADITVESQAQPEAFALIRVSKAPEVGETVVPRDSGPYDAPALMLSGEGDTVPSDAAFVELAAGYTRRTLQSPSSEASGVSLDGCPDVSTAVTLETGRQAEEHVGELTFGGAVLAAGDTVHVLEADGQDNVGRRQAALQGPDLKDSVLGSPVAATLTLCPLDEPRPADDTLTLLGGNSQVPEFTDGFCQQRSPAAAAWQSQLGHSPTRHHSWQLVGLGVESAANRNPQQAPPGEAGTLGGCVVADGGTIVTVRPSSWTTSESTRAARMPHGARHEAGVHAEGPDRGWPLEPSFSMSARGDLPASSMADAEPGTTRESSAAWESVDDGGVVGSDSSSRRPSIRASAGVNTAQDLDAAVAQPEDSAAAAAPGQRGFLGIRGSCDGGGNVLQPGLVAACQQDVSDDVDVEFRERQQPQHIASGFDVGTYGSGSSDPLHATLRDQHVYSSLALLLPDQQPPQHSLHSEQHRQGPPEGSFLPPQSLEGDLKPLGPPIPQQTVQAHEAAGENVSIDNATRQSPVMPGGGGQRQRRRWGSPLYHAVQEQQQLHHLEQQPLGAVPAMANLHMARAVTSPGHGNRAQWLLKESVGRMTSPSGRSVSGMHSGQASAATLLSFENESQAPLAVMQPISASTHGDAFKDGMLDVWPSSSPQRPAFITDEDASVPPPASEAATALSDDRSGSPRRIAKMEQLMRHQASVNVLPPLIVSDHEVSIFCTANDVVLCGSPTGAHQQPQAAAAPSGDAAICMGANSTAGIENDGPIATVSDLAPARSATPIEASHEVMLGSGSSGITANRGGISFSISTEDVGAARRPQWGWAGCGPMPAASASGTPDAPSVPSLLAMVPSAGLLGPNELPGPTDWDRLNKQLREAGFSGLTFAQAHVCSAAEEGHAVREAVPEPASLHRCLSSVLEQYVRRNRLVSDLLAATEQSGRIAEQQEAAIRELKREANAARTAAEKARRELADISSQQMPKVEARHAAQLGRLRSENAKLKEALRVSELDLSAKNEEFRSLRATISGLQSASSHSSDVEGALLRQRVAQLEALLRNRDKEVEKLKTTKEAIVGQAEDGQANALDRAYEAEATNRRLELELAAALTRIGHLEQGLRQRERDVAVMRDDLQQIKACKAVATLAAQERSAAAEEAAGRAEGEAASLRGKVKELEGAMRAARLEMEKQRSEAEALRSSAYEGLYRLEDECHSLGAELAASRTRITQLEHVLRAKERDVARIKDEKEAGKAAERERARVAEEVSVKLEAELTTAKVRLTQAEGAVRTRERELARLAELLRQTQGAEVEAWLKKAKLEEGSRKLENDFTTLRLRVLQLEATLKGRDKDSEKLARKVESLRGEAHELTSKLAKSEEAARKAEADLALSRGKVLTLEGQVRVKERQQERLVRVLEGLKAGDAEVASRQAALEEAARRLDGQLTAAKGRVSALEGVVRARDAAVERLNQQLEALKTAEFERAAQALKSKEFVRQQEAEMTALRQRIILLEGQVRAKERELEHSARQVDAARAAEADAVRRLADSTAAVARMEGEVAAGRQRAVQLGEALRGREREVAALTRALDAQRAAEHEANAVAGKTEEAARKLDGEAVELRQRLIQAEGQLRTREREVERQARALEAAQTAVEEAAMKQGEAEATVRRLEADAAGLRQRLAQAEGAVRAREKELERVEKIADQAREAESATEAKLRAAEGTVVQLDGELSSLRLHISQLEAAARGHSKEVQRLTRAIDQSKVAQADADTRAQRSTESARQVASELASARNRLAKVEASLGVREQEAQRLQRLFAAAEAQAAAQVLRSDEFVRRVEADLEMMRQRAGQLAQLIRTRERELTTLRGALEAARAAEAKATEQWRQGEEALHKVDGELAAERQRAVQLEGQVKSREREMERLSRQLDAGRDQRSTATVAAGREASTLKDTAARAEAALATARARVTQLESELVAKERQLEGLQRLVGNSRVGDAEAAAAAEERARRAEEAARRLDVELGAVRQRYAHLEHTFRSREANLDKLRAVLSEKVAQEERRVARDKATYQRIRAAYVATLGHATGGTNGGTPGAGVQQQQQRAAGAIAAAARELRPVEIVGLYETRREATEQDLAAYRAEVRSLSEQLREAQNHIAIKDRTAAWRTPSELADLQARIILLERRSADLQRELDRARLEAAEAARMAERRLAEVEHRAAQLKEDNEALVHELDSRPTLQDTRTLKREVEILEKRLLKVKGSTAASGAGADAEGGETALGLAAVAKGRHAGAMLTTSQRITRDRSLHRLGLRALEHWPKDVFVDLVQDVCIELDVRDATTLPASVRKMLRVVGAMPRMEAFIGAVCERVYLKGAPFVPPDINGTTDPSRVIEVIEVWLELLKEGAQLRGATRAIVEALAKRAEGLCVPLHGPGDVVASVRQLVEAEAMALTARESLTAASQHMAREPEHLLSRLVSHFMRLFDCPSLEGMVPAMNRLYVTFNEQRNFIRSLATALDLPSDAGAAGCIARVQELVSSATVTRGSVTEGTGVGTQTSGHRKAVDEAEVFISPALPGCGIDASGALERLMLLFGVTTATAAAEAADKLVARLKKLDEVLPRYQRLASQLFETLRVTSLEEIMPALRKSLRS